VSGRFVVTLTRTDAFADSVTTVTGRGTFVMPVVTLNACPQ
jgi:hypothetical protein